jgi:hypothetical protein
VRFIRGIAVPASTADSVIESIFQSGLNRDKGWLMVWEKPNNPEGLFKKPDLSMDDTQGPRETAPVGICFCGEESSAAVYEPPPRLKGFLTQKFFVSLRQRGAQQIRANE